MSTDETPPALAPSPALAGLAAAMPIVSLLFGCGLTGVFLAANPGTAQEVGLVGWLSFAAFLLASLVLAPLLFFSGRGKRIPSAVVLAVAASPWVVGTFGAWFATLGLADAMTGDPSMRAMLLARMVAQAMLAGALGSLVGGTLLVSAALGTGLASLAQRAQGRVSWAGILGFGATLPLAAVGAYGLMAREYFVLVVVLGALLVALGVAVGVSGAGRDETGRSGSLASAVPWIGGLGVAALMSAAVHRSTIVIFQALANAPPDLRLLMLAHGADELSPMLSARWLVPVTVVLAGLVVAAWAGVRRRPGVGQAVGAAALVLGFFSVLGFDAVTRSFIAASAPGSSVTAPPRFDGVAVDTGLGEQADPEVFVGATEIQPADGTQDTRSLREAFERYRRRAQPGDDWLAASPELVLAFDEDAPSNVLAGLAAAAGDVGVPAFAVSVSRPLTGDERDTLQSAVPVLWLAASAFSDSRTLPVIVASAADLERAHTDPLFLHTTLGREAPTTMEARPGAPFERRELSGDLSGFDVDEDAEPVPAWIVVGPQATATSFVTLLARLHANGMVPVLVTALPDASQPDPPRLTGGLIAALRGDPVDGPPAAGVFGRLGGTGPGPDGPSTGLGGRRRVAASPTPRVSMGAPTVRGSLSAEIIRRVQRRHLSQVRYCYESHLRTDPRAAGAVDLQYIIGPQGRVTTASATSSEMPGVAACISRLARRWVFPSPDGGGVVAVNQRITLASD